jgi:methyl-accepting chemotaxis protein
MPLKVAVTAARDGRGPMSRFRFTIGRRLALLGSLGLVVALLSNGGSLLLGTRISGLQAEERAYARAQTLVRELDTRASELKVDGYKALLAEEPESVRAELIEDTDKVTVRLAAMAELDLRPADAGAVEVMRTAFATFVTSINGVVDDAVADPVAARAEYEAVQVANDATDEVVGTTIDELDAGSVRIQVEGRRTVSLMVVVTFLMFGFGAVVVVVATVVLARSVNRRVRAVVGALESVAGGDLSDRLADSGSDEVAEMAGALNVALDKIVGVFRQITGTAEQLAGASSGLQVMAAEVGRSAQETSVQAEVVARTADEVSQNVQAVAAGGEEMGASIGEIAQNANEAARVATGAVASVESTTVTMNKLGDSSREIGDVVRLITSIAEQTNLLALNATIEAARAGDAGKGFAVVADEVKQLAQETARATEDISRRVETIQEDSSRAGQAILDIAGVITRINEFQTTIASAVEEQTATTQAINAGVSDAATGSGQIARNISGVAAAAGTTTRTIGQAVESARELSGMSKELADLVAGFRLVR